MQQAIKIGVAGAGAMGTGIAQVAAMAGHPVVIYDPYETSLGRSKGILDGDFSKLVSKGKLDEAKSVSIRNAITHTSSLDGLKGCGMVIEAAVEMMEVKKKLFSDLESVVD